MSIQGIRISLDSSSVQSGPIEPPSASLLDSIVESRGGSASEPARIDGVVIGEIVSIESDGKVWVQAIDVSPEALLAKCFCPLNSEQVGAQCALMFEKSDPHHPMIMGVLQFPVRRETRTRPEPFPHTGEIQIKGRQIAFEAQNELSFRCGKASVTLTREGKILLKGSYILSRSTGTNRIKGGSVQIN